MKIRGDGKRSYVMGVDPAKTHDRFAIVIIELGQPNRVVYCWTMDEIEKQTYTKGAQMMRELMRCFNITAIAMDEGGGGLAVEELLNSPGVMGDREAKLYRHDDERPEANSGLKILHTFAFNPIWLDDSNSLLQKNIEDKVLMFPRAQADDTATDFSKHDDVAWEILEMKKELVSIEVTYTKTGKKQFNLAPPDPKKDIDGVVRHKDRYSALLLANYVSSRFETLTYDPVTTARNLYNQSVKFCGFREDLERMASDFDQ